jgi:hypothetical protein
MYVHVYVRTYVRTRVRTYGMSTAFGIRVLVGQLVRTNGTNVVRTGGRPVEAVCAGPCV